MTLKMLTRLAVVAAYPKMIMEVWEEEALLEEKSQRLRELNSIAWNKEKVVARAVHAEMDF